MGNIENIIRYAPKKMQPMLKSVAYYNSGFSSSDLGNILFAMSVIDRKFFVGIPGAEYDDNALPIGSGQTISQPSTVARMLLLSELRESDEVLDIGAGSGWNAALIAFLVYPGKVVSVDRIFNLIEKAEKNISKLRNYLKQKRPQDIQKLEKINFLAEDIFSKGRAWKKRYDKIIITAGISDKRIEEKIKSLAENLLKKHGILICPNVTGPLIIYRKNKFLNRQETSEEYVFVPLLEGTER